jgi:hypothetical protein
VVDSFESVCLLGCEDGHVFGGVIPGLCTAVPGSDTAAVQGQSVACIPATCAAPQLDEGQAALAGCNEGAALGAPCTIGCSAGWEEIQDPTPGFCAPELGRETASFQVSNGANLVPMQTAVTCGVVNVCLQAVCHANSTCGYSGPGAAVW